MAETEQVLERDDHEESERDDKLNEDSSGLPRSPGASLGNQTSTVTITEEREDDSDESDSDSDEECDNHANVSTGIDRDVS